jgi:hypothetical protein
MKYFWLLCLGLMAVGCSATSPSASDGLTPAPANQAAPATATGTMNTEVQSPVGNDGAGDSQASAQEQAESGRTDGMQTNDVETPDKPVSGGVDHADLLNQILFARSGGLAALEQIRNTSDARYVAGLIDSLRYRRDIQEEIGLTLNELTGQELAPDWFEWVEWAGNNPEVETFAGYAGWKASLFAQIDPNFLRFVHPEVPVDPQSRVEEIVWGGVQVDGIPALDNPTMIDPEQADYLEADERIFGVSINGDTRAYPARFLDWHEMFNDIVGGEPVSLAY